MYIGPIAAEVLVQIKYVSVLVEDQEHALDFYTNILGFEKVADIPVGEARWLTVTSPDGPQGVELLLEPMGFPPARDYQNALFEAGIPATAFVTADIQTDFERLKSAGVVFRAEPTDMGPVTAAVFEDTCGNIIQLVEPAV
jgi:catechol 2,3-dioxygenase-like lactoylglutathione lyase family enzyme